MKLRAIGNRNQSFLAYSLTVRNRVSQRSCARSIDVEDSPILLTCSPLEWRRLRLVLVCVALWLSGFSCSSAQSTDRLTEVLEDSDVVVALKYEPIDDIDRLGLSPQQAVSLDVDEFVVALVASDGGVPSWLAIPELTPTAGITSPTEGAESIKDVLRDFFPAELGEDGRRYVWSLYWALSMPPEAVQREILESEFTGKDRSSWDFDGFRARYPEYLEEIAHTWLDVNRDSRPAQLNIE